MFKTKRKIKRTIKRNKIVRYKINRNKIKTRKNTQIKRKIIIYLFLAAIISIFYLLFFSNIFKVQKIDNINNTIETKALSDKIKSELRYNLSKNLILLNSQKTAEQLIKKFPELETIEIQKKFPNTLAFKFDEFPLSANLIVESSNLKKTYILNSLGFIIKENYENPTLPFIKMQTEEAINPDKKAIDKETLEYIISARQYFEEKFGMKVKEVIYKPIPRELHLLTERDFYIWLDIQQDYEEQLQKLKKASSEIDIYNEDIEYIDLRISVLNGSKIILK